MSTSLLQRPRYASLLLQIYRNLWKPCIWFWLNSLPDFVIVTSKLLILGMYLNSTFLEAIHSALTSATVFIYSPSTSLELLRALDGIDCIMEQTFKGNLDLLFYFCTFYIWSIHYNVLLCFSPKGTVFVTVFFLILLYQIILNLGNISFRFEDISRFLNFHNFGFRLFWNV